MEDNASPAAALPPWVTDFRAGGTAVRLYENDAVVAAADDTAWRAATTISDHWRAESDRLQAIVAGLRARAHAFSYGARDTTEVEVGHVDGIELYGAQQTIEHDDRGFPRWTALLVVNTAGHRLTVDDMSVTMTPAAGDIVLFDLHRRHELDMPDWLEPVEWPDQPRPQDLFLCAHLDFDFEHLPAGGVPSRALVETMLERHLLRSYTPVPTAEPAPAP